MPVHKPPSITTQEHRRVRHIPHNTKPPHRHGLLTCASILLADQALQTFGTGDATGRDDVTGDAARAELDSTVGAEGVDASFGDADVGLEGQTGVVDGGGNEDDARGAGARGGGEEMRLTGLDSVVGAENVDVNDGLEGIGRELADLGR